MKKYLSTLTALVFLGLNTVQAQPRSATAQKNLDAMLAIQKCFDTKDFGKLADYIANDAVDHSGATGDIKGLAAMKLEFEKTMEYTDSTMSEVIKELADDEFVMLWIHNTGVLKNDMVGQKAGERFEMRTMELAKFRDGKVVEHWTFMELAEMMKMMNNMGMAPPEPVEPPKPPPPPPPVKKKKAVIKRT